MTRGDHAEHDNQPTRPGPTPATPLRPGSVGGVIGTFFALLFVVVPIIELYLIVQVSHAIGFLNTLVILIGFSIAGAWLVKRQGVRVWQRFNQAIAENKVPSKEIAQGVCLLIAGALMITPGFFTDAIGLLLLLPPSQALLLRLLSGRVPGGTRVVRATYRGRQVFDATVHDDRDDGPRPPAGELDR